MELLYLYIQDFRNIKDVEFCFSNKWEIKYNKSQNRIDFKTRKQKLPEDFYGSQISNVTVLVGENGAGKTECLSFIRNYLPNNTSASIAIIADSQSTSTKIHSFYHYTLPKFKIFPLTCPEYELESVEECGSGVNDKLEAFLSKNIKTVYVNFGLQLRHDLSANAIDLSTLNRLEEFENHNKKQKVTDAYRIGELDDIVKYLNSPEYIKKPFHAGKRLDSIGITFENIFQSKSLSKDMMDIVNSNGKFVQYLRLLTTNRDASLEKGWLKTKRQLVYKVLFGLALIYTKKQQIPFDIENISTSKLQAEIKSFISKNLQNPERSFYEFICNLPAGALVTEIKLFDLSGRKRDYHFSLVQFKLNISFAHQWLDKYAETVEANSYLSYYWNLSSGELAFLSYFSRIYSKKSILDQYSSIWLQIDESDLHLHPEWQREFFLLFTQFLNETFHNKKIQIFLATHSPFILSDVPKQHVIFLKRNGRNNTEIIEDAIEEETFGGNIHQLFRYSFFLDKGFIGRFAEGKINSVIEDLNSRRSLSIERRDEIQRIIYSIGEPIIRNRLVQLYNDKFNLDVDSRLEFLENEIKVLKKR